MTTTKPRVADRSRAIVDLDALTPIDWYDGLAYKRDDLLLPFDDIDLNGGKVRQALKLVGSQLDTIRNEYGATLLTATSVHSPQGLIIARVAHHYGLDCVLFIGATTARRTLMEHKMMRAAVGYGAIIDDSCGTGYSSALAAALAKWRARNGRGFPIQFGMSVDSARDAIIGSTAAQCSNIPDEIETVVIAVGSGITAAGIIEGLHERNIDIRCVQIAGYDRRATIGKITAHSDFKWYESRAYPYSRQLVRKVAPGFTLDPIYEAKAHEYMARWLDVPRERTLFWIVGDSGVVR